MLIRNVVALTPVWNEPLGMIQQFERSLDPVCAKLNAQGIGFRHFFLDDGATHLADESSVLVRHERNRGLAHTIVDGYEAVAKLKAPADLVVKIDCQEHDAELIPRIVDHMDRTRVRACYLPVVYTVEGQSCRRMVWITETMNRLAEALDPIDPKTVLDIYNQVFPLGFQAYRADLLAEITPKLRAAIDAYRQKYQMDPTWGFDLLAILHTAAAAPGAYDFMFGGWMEPWKENRTDKHVQNQRDRVAKMIDLAVEGGCRSQQAA